jgi:hypothetical protein
VVVDEFVFMTTTLGRPGFRPPSRRFHGAEPDGSSSITHETGPRTTQNLPMPTVLLAGRITPRGRLLRPVGNFTVSRHSTGRFSVKARNADLSLGRVVAILSSEEGTLAHFNGGRHRGEIHTVSADDGSYVDVDVEFVLYKVARGRELTRRWTPPRG